jgi:hypothetical protein
MTNENTIIKLGRYQKTARELCLDGNYREGWGRAFFDLVATVKEKPYEVLKELFPFYQISQYRGIVIRTPQLGIFSKHKNNALVISPASYDENLNSSINGGIYRTKIASARRSQNMRNEEVLRREAREIIRVLSEKHPLSDQIKRNYMERLIAVEEAKYALSDYL